MSRIGRAPIPVPAGVEIDITGNVLTVQGPRGQLSRTLHPEMSIKFVDGQILVSRPSDARNHRALHGLTRSLVANMVQGVTQGFLKGLEISGVGYRAQKLGDRVIFTVGFSHPVEVLPPAGITFSVESPTRMQVGGIDKEVVGEVAARLRAIRPPEPYKGKGIRYQGEKIKLKAGKAGKAGGKKK
ncbi:MAG: 50S ribosomal protein L6 [Dehalococcoidia bacterium]|nr:50S ribosomal protein L6 [Dehalococcoidia bacterium]